MWMLSWVPDSLLLHLVNTMLVGGLIATVVSIFLISRLLRWFPALAVWYPIVQAVSIAVFLAGVYFKGSYQTETEWRARVAQAEEKVQVAEQQAREANAALDSQGKEKIKIIKGKTEYITRYIDKEIVKYDTKFMPGGTCEIPQEFIKAHNQSAERPK